MSATPRPIVLAATLQPIRHEGPLELRQLIEWLAHDAVISPDEARRTIARCAQAESRQQIVTDGWRPGMSLADALRLALTALEHREDSATASIDPGQLEAAVLDRGRTRRAFRRLAAAHELGGGHV